MSGVVQVERVVELTRASAASSCRVDQGALARVLRGAAGGRPVAVLSVAGCYRSGKSFLLNYCLRYLAANDDARRDGSWLGNSQQLTGFSWSAGDERNTTGIWMSTPLEVTLPSGQKVAVVLMDTQGTFDCQSTLRDCSTIFALSTLLSSMQIYNLKENITSNDLQYLKSQTLQFFADYGRLAMSGESPGHPFQALRFLVRDRYDPPYGLEGGRRLLEARMGEQSQLTPELHEVSREIRRCFESVDCYLMPHPGLAVPSSNYRGNVAELAPAFQTALLDLIPSMLAPNNLRLKKLNGLSLTGQQLFQYFQSLAEVFSSGTMPELNSLFEAHEEASLANAAWTAQQRFRAEMERTCGEHAPRCPPHVLREKQARARHDALQALQAAASDQRRREWQQRLEQEFDATLNQYLQINQRKNEMAVSTAKNMYETAVLGDIAARDICKHPYDLEKAHERGQAAALQEFDRNRERPTGVDAERNEFQTWITRRYNELKTKNESNNEAAVTACHEYFLGIMPGPTPHQISNAVTSFVKVFTMPYVVPFEFAEDVISIDRTRELFRATKAEALARFDRKRNAGGSSYDSDNYKDRLKELIEAYEFPVSRYHVFSYRADIDSCD